MQNVRREFLDEGLDIIIVVVADIVDDDDDGLMSVHTSQAKASSNIII